MKKRILITLLLGLSIGIIGCGNSSSTTETTTESTTAEEPETSEYADLIEMLNNDDFDSAIDYVTNLKTEKMKEEAGDIADYLVTVDINDDNFSDYFECVKFKKYNSFGEEDTQMKGYGLKSLAYDEGLIFYNADGVNVELATDGWKSDDSLSSLLSNGCFVGSGSSFDELTVEFSRVTDGTVTFVKSDYVDSYELEDYQNPDPHYKKAVITLKNGEVIERGTNPDYLY